MMQQLESLDLSKLGGPRLAEIGKIKIGGKGRETVSRQGKKFRLPEKYDHFLITTNFRDPNTDDFVPDWELMNLIGKQTKQDPKKLRMLPIMLLFDDPTLNFFARFSCYQGNQAWCVGDGTKALRLTGNTNSNRSEVSCPCERILPTYPGKDRCKVFGRLSVLFRGINRLGGVWVFRTTSWNSVRNLLSAMHLIRQVTGGVLAGIPLELTLNPKTVILPEGKQQTVYVVNLEFPGSAEQLAELGYQVHRKRLEHKVRIEALEEQVRRNLAALPDDEDGGVTPQDIQEEFYPENEDAVEMENGTRVDPETGEVIQGQDQENTSSPEEPKKSRKLEKPSTPPAEIAGSFPTTDSIQETLF